MIVVELEVLVNASVSKENMETYQSGQFLSFCEAPTVCSGQYGGLGNMIFKDLTGSLGERG